MKINFPRHLTPIFLTLFLAPGFQIQAQEKSQSTVSKNRQAGTPGAVLRISKSLIDELTDDEIEAKFPFQATILKAHSVGTAIGKAKMSIELQPGPQTAVFIITATGEATGNFSAYRDGFRVDGTLRAPFTVQKRVEFDGLKYSSAETTSQVCLTASICRVASQKDNPLFTIVQPLARTGVQFVQADAERQAIPIAKMYLEEFVNNEADKVIEELNQTTPLEDSMLKLYPETKEWVYHLSTEKEYMQAYFGPRNQSVPSLPEVKSRPTNVGMELWIQATPEEAKFLKLLAEWNKAHDLLDKFVPQSDPAIAALIKDATVTVADPWVIISIAQPAK